MLRDLFLSMAQERVTPRDDRLRATVQAYVDSLNSGDIEARITLFAPDASFEDPVGTPPIIGHAGLRAFWQAAGDMSIVARLEMLAINGNEAAYVFSVAIGTGDEDRVSIRPIETLRVDDAGLITCMRAYFDMNSIK